MLLREAAGHVANGTHQPVAADQAARREPVGSFGRASTLVAWSTDGRKTDGVGAADDDVLDELGGKARERLVALEAEDRRPVYYPLGDNAGRLLLEDLLGHAWRRLRRHD